MVKQITVFLLLLLSFNSAGWANVPQIVDVLRNKPIAVQGEGKVVVDIAGAANIFMETTELTFELSSDSNDWWFDTQSVDLAAIPLASGEFSYSQDDMETIGATLLTSNNRYYFYFIKFWKDGRLVTKMVKVETVIPELATTTLFIGAFALLILINKRR